MTSRSSLHRVVFFSLVTSAAIAGPQAAESIIVNTYNSAGAPDSVIASAQVQAGRWFRDAGITIQWVNCPPLDWRLRDRQICNEPHDPRLFTVTITGLKVGLPVDSMALGFALPRAGGGNHAAVLYPLIERVAVKFRVSIDLDKLLANVMAHELGHLLFGSTDHGPGIMKPHWDRRELEAIAENQSGFSCEQEKQLRLGLTARVAAWSTANLVAPSAILREPPEDRRPRVSSIP